MANGSSLLLGYAARHELEDLPVPVHHRYRGVLSRDQLAGKFDEPPE
jgi:hypothetical protein